MRTAPPRPDPAQILLDRRPMPGQPRPIGPWAVGAALVGLRIGRGRRPASALTRGGDDDSRRIGDGRVEQLDLDPDDRVEPRLLGGRDESDGPVEPLVVGDGEAGQAQLDGSLDELVRGRGAVEEREIRMAVELGVGNP